MPWCTFLTTNTKTITEQEPNKKTADISHVLFKTRNTFQLRHRRKNQHPNHNKTCCQLFEMQIHLWCEGGETASTNSKLWTRNQGSNRLGWEELPGVTVTPCQWVNTGNPVPQSTLEQHFAVYHTADELSHPANLISKTAAYKDFFFFLKKAENMFQTKGEENGRKKKSYG